MQDVNIETRSQIYDYYDNLLVQRHTMVAMPFTADHVNRLTTPKAEWPYVSWMRRNRPNRLRYVTHVLIEPEKLDFEPMRLPQELHSPVDVQTYFSIGRSRVRPSEDHPLHGIVSPVQDADEWQPSDQRVVAPHVDRDTKLFRQLQKWAAQHYKIAYENLLAYYTIVHALENVTTWKQLKKHWPEFMQELQRVRSTDPRHELARRVDDMRDVDASRARNIDPVAKDILEKYRRVVMPTILHGALIEKSVPVNTEMTNRAIYRMMMVRTFAGNSQHRAGYMSDWFSS